MKDNALFQGDGLTTLFKELNKKVKPKKKKKRKK